MNYIKRFSALMIVIVTVAALGITAVKASAEASAFISLPDSVSAGESFEVRLSFDADTPIGLIETDLVFSDSLAAFTGGSAYGSGGVIHVKEVSDRESLNMSVPLTFTAIAPGEITFSLSNCRISSPDGTPISVPSASSVMTVAAGGTDNPAESDEPGPDQSSQSDKDENGIPYHGVLKSITVYEGELIPEFSPLIYDYVVKVGHDVEVFEVDAERRSEEDSIWFEGSKKLSETGTVRTIRVYDDNGHDNTYRIVVQRAPAPEESADNEEPSSQEEISPNTAAAVVTTASPQADTSEEEEISSDHGSSLSSKASSSSSASGMSELRQKLMPWLIIILIVLILALCIIIIWIKNKSERKRRKIKSSSGKR